MESAGGGGNASGIPHSSARKEELTTAQPPTSQLSTQLNLSRTSDPPRPSHSSSTVSPASPHPTVVVKPRTLLSTSSSRSNSSHAAVPPAQPSSSYHAQQIQALSSMLEAQQQAKAELPSPATQPSHTPPLTIPSPLAPRQKQRVMLQRLETPSEEQEEINKMAAEEVQGDLSTEVFSPYTAQHPVFACAKPHPADIVEAASLADVALPPPTYNLAPYLLESGHLSALQLEGVLYACQRHLTLLPGGSRAGFFIGDGAGVGKGRQIAGIIFDNYARGRCKHIWFSVSHDLKMDAERDLRDIGCYIKVIDGCQQLDKETRILGLPADFKEGVVFSTYATLVSTVQRGGQSRSRLQQLVTWCGGQDFDGCLIFDECHKAKNFVPGKEQQSTKVALAVSSVQRLLPKARVVYCSATGVSDVKNMAYMERLGLWGEGLAYRNFESFLESITRRGLGAAEMMAMEMKSAGMYVSRGLSFKQAEFTTHEVPLTSEQVVTYDSASHVWNELRSSLSIALSRVGAPNQRVWATFWSAHQRFFKQLCMSMKVPAIVAEAKQALIQNMAVVIGLQTTGESSLENEMERSEGELSGFVSLCKEILQRFVQEHFPTTITSTVSQDVPIQDLWSVTAKDMLLEFIAKMQLPDSPLDALIDQLGGVRNVAEMTGRRGRMVRQGEGKREKIRYELRDTGGNALESLNNVERASFMNGEKLVAVISDAASTGISLHSDLNVANQRRRLHITMELPWSADKAVQQLGRSHRANQSSGPLYVLVTTNVGGERRFAAAVAKRLQTLGALTKGDRRAATGAEFSEFNFDTQYGRTALRQMYNSIHTRKLFGGVTVQRICYLAGETANVTIDQFFTSLQSNLEAMGLVEGGVVKEGYLGDVSKFLNRLLGLKVLEQNKMFAYFCECLSTVISIAKKEGRFNEGVTDIRAQSIQMVGTPREVFVEHKLSHVPTIHTQVVVDRGVHWEEVLQLYQQQATDGASGFFRSKREQYSRHLYLLALKKENSTHLFNIIRPNTGRSFFEETKTDLLHKYVSISPDKAEKGWRSQYEMTKSLCIHGLSCKKAQSCLIGSRLSHLHLLSGGLLPLLSLLETTMVRYAHTLEHSKDAHSLRVVRVKLDNGKRVIGVRYPLPLISEVASMLRMVKNSTLVDAGQKLPAVIPTAAKDLIIETETPINKRSLGRALKPPVSLKNFFTVEPNAHGAGQTDNEGSGAYEAHKKEEPGPSWASGTTSKQLIHKATSAKAHPKKESHISKNKGVQLKLVDSFTAVLPPTSTENPIIVKDEGSQETRPVKDMMIGKRKRRSQDVESDCSSPLVKVFKKTEKQSIMTCPICGFKFEDTSNSGINHHLDICLAGTSSHQSSV